MNEENIIIYDPLGELQKLADELEQIKEEHQWHVNISA